MSLVSSPGALAAHGSAIDGVTTHALPMARSISPIEDANALFRLLKLLRCTKPLIVEFSTPKAGLLGSIAAWICRVPVRIYFIRGLRLETASTPMRLVLLWSERLASACAHRVVVNSDSLLEQTLALGIAAREKLTLLGKGSSNGVDTLRFSPGNSMVRAELGIPEGAPVVGYVGRLTIDKGIPELIEAFPMILRANPDCYLLLVGWFDASDDALGLQLRKRIEGHPRIVCTGYVVDAAPYYRAMDVLVHPSWREGFPNVLLEAAASGLPVVATSCTGSCDAVVPEATGLLVEPGNPRELARAMVRILGDRQLRRSMGLAARNWALTYFEERRVSGEVARFYRQLLTDAAGETTREKGIEPATGWTASL